MTITVSIRRVIDAIFAIDGIHGILAERRHILGEELEAALCRLTPQAAVALASRSDVLTYTGRAGDMLSFEVTNDKASAEVVETALMWQLLRMCRPGNSGSTSADVVASSARSILDSIDSSADCPARRSLHWLD